MVHSLHVHFKNDKRNIFRLSLFITVWKKTRLLLNSDSSCRVLSCSAWWWRCFLWAEKGELQYLFTFIHLYFTVLFLNVTAITQKLVLMQKITPTCFPKIRRHWQVHLQNAEIFNHLKLDCISSITWLKGERSYKTGSLFDRSSSYKLNRIKNTKMQCVQKPNMEWLLPFKQEVSMNSLYKCAHTGPDWKNLWLLCSHNDNSANLTTKTSIFWPK